MLLTLNVSEAFLISIDISLFIEKADLSLEERKLLCGIKHLLDYLGDKITLSTMHMGMLREEKTFITVDLTERKKELLKKCISCRYNDFIREWNELYEPEAEFFEESVLARHSKPYEFTWLEFLLSGNREDLETYMSLVEKLQN